MNKEEILEAIKAGKISDYTLSKTEGLEPKEEKEFFEEFAGLVSSLRAENKIESYYVVNRDGVDLPIPGDLKVIED
jgi:hypothetical protein